MDLREILPAGHGLLDCIEPEVQLQHDEKKVIWKWKTSYKDFNIAFDDYFFLKNHPDHPYAKFIDNLTEGVYMDCARSCNEEGTHTIHCWNDRYICRTPEEIERVEWESKTPEEQAQITKENRINELNSLITEQKNYLSSTDYIIAKLNEYSLLGGDELEEAKAQYAEDLENRKKARVLINEYQEEIDALNNE